MFAITAGRSEKVSCRASGEMSAGYKKVPRGRKKKKREKKSDRIVGRFSNRLISAGGAPAQFHFGPRWQLERTISSTRAISARRSAAAMGRARGMKILPTSASLAFVVVFVLRTVGVLAERDEFPSCSCDCCEVERSEDHDEVALAALENKDRTDTTYEIECDAKLVLVSMYEGRGFLGRQELDQCRQSECVAPVDDEILSSSSGGGQTRQVLDLPRFCKYECEPKSGKTGGECSRRPNSRASAARHDFVHVKKKSVKVLVNVLSAKKTQHAGANAGAGDIDEKATTNLERLVNLGESLTSEAEKQERDVESQAEKTEQAAKLVEDLAAKNSQFATEDLPNVEGSVKSLADAASEALDKLKAIKNAVQKAADESAGDNVGEALTETETAAREDALAEANML